MSNADPSRTTITVPVDYDRSVEDGNEAGKYDFGDSSITTEHFPPNRTGRAELEIELVHFGPQMTNNEVLIEFEKLGLRPAELRELQAIGEHHPELQREYPILALGSEWLGYHDEIFRPALRGDDVRREIGLYGVGLSVWHSICRFSAVRVRK